MIAGGGCTSRKHYDPRMVAAVALSTHMTRSAPSLVVPSLILPIPNASLHNLPCSSSFCVTRFDRSCTSVRDSSCAETHDGHQRDRCSTTANLHTPSLLSSKVNVVVFQSVATAEAATQLWACIRFELIAPELAAQRFSQTAILSLCIPHNPVSQYPRDKCRCSHPLCPRDGLLPSCRG